MNPVVRPAAWLWTATIVLVALNLRPFLTSVGPMGQTIQQSTGISLQALSALTLLPMALMGAGTWLAPLLLRVLPPRSAMLLGLALIGTGCALRLLGTEPGMLVGSALLCGLGAAAIQGILPSLVKLFSPQRIAVMMAVYSAALMGGGALGAQLSPLALHWGMSWQGALAIWLWPVMVAMLLAWYPLGALSRASPVPQQPEGGTAWLLLRSRTWLLIVFFGLLNSGYASMVAWMAPHYQTLGWSAAGSGFLVAVLSVAQAVTALVLPIFARHQTDRRPWIWFTLLCQGVGFTALAWFPLASPAMTAAVLGVGLGGCFAFLMIVALDHLPDPLQAGTLNALMQGGGYILAALGPWILASLHQYLGSFEAGWQFHLGAVLVMAMMTALWSPQGYAQAMRAPLTGTKT